MGPKYEFTNKTLNHDGHVLHQIRRLSDGELGGWIEKEENLSQEGECWVSGNAKVYDDAKVYGNAYVSENAQVYGNAKVYENADVWDEAQVYGNAKIYDQAQICGDVKVHGNATVYDNYLIDSGEYVANEADEEMNDMIDLATYIAKFTYRAEDSFNVDIKGRGGLSDLDYETCESWGAFNGTITYSILKTSFEITVEFPDYADLYMRVTLSSKKLGIDTYIDTVEELKTELKHIAEKLTEFIGPEGSNALLEII